MGFIRAIEFPISDGAVVEALLTGLTADGWGTGLSGGTVTPDTKTRRMFTVRDDSGPQDGRNSRRRQGVNVWADDPVDALNMALDAMKHCRALPNGDPITATDTFTGPFEVPTSTPHVVGGKELTNFYFTFRLSVKGSKP